jgi:radical SAM superfamily enzyme YgiQ (UPF0313 family)
LHTENGQIIVNEPQSKISNLDDLPYPAFDLVVIQNLSYFDSKRRILPILTSRGVQTNVFCSTSVMHGKYYRAETRKIVDEIEYIKKYEMLDCT